MMVVCPVCPYNDSVMLFRKWRWCRNIHMQSTRLVYNTKLLFFMFISHSLPSRPTTCFIHFILDRSLHILFITCSQTKWTCLRHDSMIVGCMQGLHDSYIQACPNNIPHKATPNWFVVSLIFSQTHFKGLRGIKINMKGKTGKNLHENSNFVRNVLSFKK